MVDLVNVRSTQGRSHKQFLVDARLVEKYPDHYVVVEAKKPATKKAAPKAAESSAPAE